MNHLDVHPAGRTASREAIQTQPVRHNYSGTVTIYPVIISGKCVSNIVISLKF